MLFRLRRLPESAVPEQLQRRLRRLRRGVLGLDRTADELRVHERRRNRSRVLDRGLRLDERRGSSNLPLSATGESVYCPASRNSAIKSNVTKVMTRSHLRRRCQRWPCDVKFLRSSKARPFVTSSKTVFRRLPDPSRASRQIANPKCASTKMPAIRFSSKLAILLPSAWHESPPVTRSEHAPK